MILSESREKSQAADADCERIAAVFKSGVYMEIPGGPGIDKCFAMGYIAFFIGGLSMANHMSAIKKHRRDLRKRMVNKMNRSRMRTQIKKFRKSIDAGDLDTARSLYPKVISVIDRVVSKGTIHANTGSRYKSRLSHLLNRTASNT